MHYLKNILLMTAMILGLSFAASCKAGQTASSQVTVQPTVETQATAPPRVTRYTFEVVNAYPHDPRAFTQGLLYHQGALYESTGLYGESSLRKVELQTGKVLQKIDVPSQYFAEGLALFNNRLFQITWQSQRAFAYDLDSFNQLGTFNYTGEGWGITQDAHSLIMSDGTSHIRFLDPSNFSVQRAIEVKDGSYPVTELNELEYVKGEIFANIWQTDRIARIDPQSGRVTGWINLAGLLSPGDTAGRPVDVLNGIAYDETGDRLFVTGKLWPKLFEIKVLQRPAPPRR